MDRRARAVVLRHKVGVGIHDLGQLLRVAQAHGGVEGDGRVLGHGRVPAGRQGGSSMFGARKPIAVRVHRRRAQGCSPPSGGHVAGHRVDSPSAACHTEPRPVSAALRLLSAVQRAARGRKAGRQACFLPRGREGAGRAPGKRVPAWLLMRLQGGLLYKQCNNRHNLASERALWAMRAGPEPAPAASAGGLLPDARLLRCLIVLSKHLLGRSDGGGIVRVDVPACSTADRRLRWSARLAGRWLFVKRGTANVGVKPARHPAWTHLGRGR